MSRISNAVEIPSGVEIKLADNMINVKGSKGQLSFALHNGIEMDLESDKVSFKSSENIGAKALKKIIPMTGTTRAIVANMISGVSNGFEKKMTLVGVGYRTQVQGNKITLNLGFSHPVVHELPEGITAEAPSQTELVIRGIDKQLVGQVAANIRAYRPPEPYKGKGIRYADEYVARKEAKKK